MLAYNISPKHEYDDCVVSPNVTEIYVLLICGSERTEMLTWPPGMAANSCWLHYKKNQVIDSVQEVFELKHIILHLTAW